MATPVLEACAADGRFSEVVVLVRAHLAGVLADGPIAPLVRPIARGDEASVYARERPGAALLLSTSLGSAWRAFRARVPLRAGAALHGRRALLTHALVPPTRAGRRVPIPSAHLLRDVAGLVGVATPDLHPRLHVREELVLAQRARLARAGLEPGRYLLCCPGAAFGAAKLWPPEHFARAIDVLHERTGLRAVVSGGPGEEPLIEAVCLASASGALSLAREERDLETLKALVADAALVLVGDSGPRWYAAAFDVPCVSVIGPNFPELTATSLEHAAVVRLDPPLECMPCLEKRCPLGHHRCMRELAPERVVEAALALLARERPVREERLRAEPAAARG